MLTGQLSETDNLLLAISRSTRSLFLGTEVEVSQKKLGNIVLVLVRADAMTIGLWAPWLKLDSLACSRMSSQDMLIKGATMSREGQSFFRMKPAAKVEKV